MFAKKNLIFTCIYTVLFTILIFLGKAIFLSFPEEEEVYIEPSLEKYETSYESFSGVTQSEVQSALHSLIYEDFKEKHEYEEKDKVHIHYIPNTLYEEIQYSYVPLIESFLYNKNILSKIKDLGVILHYAASDTRGRMKSKKVHMYGITRMSDEEFLAVLVHEFAHYVDIYSFPRSHFGDESQKFYDISWKSVSVMKKGLSGEDFVSGYAMTNMYEDFAESYTYYVLHNKDFFSKAEKSDILKKKYDFFQNYVFKRNIFYKENFSPDYTYDSYYWDVTKIPVDVKNFLHYLQKLL